MALENVVPKSPPSQANNSGTEAEASPESAVGSGDAVSLGAKDSPAVVEAAPIPFARARGLRRLEQISNSGLMQFQPRSITQRRRLPNLSAAAFVLDLFCIGTVQTVWMKAIDNWIALSGPVDVLFAAGISTLVNVIVLYALGTYRREAFAVFGVVASRSIAALGFSSVVLFALLHYGWAGVQPPGTNFPGIAGCALYALAGSAVSLCSVAVSRGVIYMLLNRQWLTRRILVIGSGKRAQYLKELMGRATHGLASDFIFVRESVLGGDAEDERIALSSADAGIDDKSVDALCRKYLIDEIVVAIDEGEKFSFEPLLACKANGTPVIDYDSFIERETNRVDLTRPDLSRLVYSNGFRLSLIHVCMKRILDIAVSLVLLLVSAPVLLLAMAAVAIGRDGPVIFRQQRVTLDGRVFWLYKLRTMRQDAESNGPRWSHAKDTRVTRVGAILRRFRIDEIPQLFNVLRGEMSLVGPRPEQPKFVEQLSREIRFYDLRHTVKAGITGWAQINYPYGASTTDAVRKLEYDLYYIKNYSLIRELSILLQTVRVLIWPPRAD